MKKDKVQDQSLTREHDTKKQTIWETMPELGILCPTPNKKSSARNGLHIVKALARSLSWSPSNIMGY